LSEAKAAFLDAETESAEDLLSTAEERLTARGEAIETDELVELYQFQAMVHMVQGHQRAAVRATERALSVLPTGKALPELGEAYAAHYKAVARDMSRETLTIDVEGDGTLRVDGREGTGGRTLKIVEGEHLVQIETADGWVSHKFYIGEDTVLHTEGMSMADAD
jgi:hypothetical protein